MGKIKGFLFAVRHREILMTIYMDVGAKHPYLNTKSIVFVNFSPFNITVKSK